MLTIVIPEREVYNESENRIVKTKQVTLQLEHSLVSLAKWESKWLKPFISPTNEEKTMEETIDYVRCMTITQNVDPMVYNFLTEQNLLEIKAYIQAPMTATTIKEINKPGKRETITAELIYYWMIANEIPPEYQKWHLNRLLMLIRVCSIKSQPAKKMSKSDILKQNAALNAARRRK